MNLADLFGGSNEFIFFGWRFQWWTIYRRLACWINHPKALLKMEEPLTGISETSSGKRVPGTQQTSSGQQRVPGTPTSSGDTILITAIVTAPPALTGLVKGVLALSGRRAAQLGIVAGDRVEW